MYMFFVVVARKGSTIAHVAVVADTGWLRGYGYDLAVVDKCHGLGTQPFVLLCVTEWMGIRSWKYRRACTGIVVGIHLVISAQRHRVRAETCKIGSVGHVAIHSRGCLVATVDSATLRAVFWTPHKVLCC